MPSRPAAKTHQKILLVGLGLGLAFLLLEVSLQAAASVRRLGASTAASVRPRLPHDGA